MSEHGHGHGGHESHGGGETAGFMDLLFPISLMQVYTKDGMKGFLEGMTDMAWDSGLGAPSASHDSLAHLFGAEGGGGGHGGGGHGGGHGGHH